MPHLTVEYSSNLAAKVDMGGVLSAAHQAALDTGAFVPSALRTRGVERTRYIVGDCHPDNAFVHVLVRLRPGRTDAQRQAIGEQILGALARELDSYRSGHPLGITLEVHEIDIRFRFLCDNLAEYHQGRRGSQHG